MNLPVKPVDTMSIADLHRAAMEWFDIASEVATVSGCDAARNEYRNAFEFEAEAARRLAPRLDFEPTRSVIHRSAAAIAIRSGDYPEAERLVTVALAGHPHPEIAEELRDMLAQITAERFSGS